MAELTREAMNTIFERYKENCHERKIHRRKTFEYIVAQDACAVTEFKRRQRGLVASDTDLWSELTNYRKEYTSGVTGPLIRKALRTFLEKEQNSLCCYCQRPLVNIAHAKPIEHILPRVDFVQYTFHFWNLAVACFDCNQIKLDANWANTGKHDLEHYPDPVEFTEMYHPRFHKFVEHVRFIRVQTNEYIITLYIGITDQGRHLCLKLLKELSAREIMLNSNPELKTALEVINAYAARNEGDIPPALAVFQDVLARSTSHLIKSRIR